MTDILIYLIWYSKKKHPDESFRIPQQFTIPGILASETMMYAAAIAALESDP